MADESKAESSFSIVNALSLAIVLAYIAAMPMWMWYPPDKVPPEILAIINQMMGAWGMAFATVVAFHLGSSRSSKDAQKATTDAVSSLTAAATNGSAKTPVVAAQVENTEATLANTDALKEATTKPERRI